MTYLFDKNWFDQDLSLSKPVMLPETFKKFTSLSYLKLTIKFFYA